MRLFFKKKSHDAAPRRRQEEPLKERANEVSLSQRYAFKRNRTLTGSASSLVSSPVEASAQLKSARVQAHELVRQRRHLGAILLLVLAGAGLLFWLISEFTASTTLRATDASMVLDKNYEKIVQEYFTRHPIERLRFLSNDKALSEYVTAAAPEIAAIHTEGYGGFGASVFIITMRQPIASWSINGHQHFVDATGAAFEHNYYATPAVQVVDNSGIQVNSGQTVASNKLLGFIGRLVGLARGQGFAVQQVVIPLGVTRQVELRVAGVAYPIKLSIDRGAGEQIEDMARGITWLQSHGAAPQYLDVRVGGKAFYR